jgi:hypothetical protein
MCRTLLLPLVVGGLALGLPFVRGHLAERDGRVAARGEALEEAGVLAVPDARVRFTLYWPDAEPLGTRSLVIFAADARATHPRPLRLFARAAAAAGVAAVYLEPTEAPAEIAARLRGVLLRQASPLGMEGASVFMWVEGTGFHGPLESPCSQSGRLAAAVAWLKQDALDTSHLVQRVLAGTLGAGCSLRERL